MNTLTCYLDNVALWRSTIAGSCGISVGQAKKLVVRMHSFGSLAPDPSMG